MTAIRNSAVAQGYITTGGFTNVYVVPSGFVFLLKNIILHQTGGTPFDWILNLVAAGGVTNVIFAHGNNTANDDLYWSGWTAMNAGDTLRVNTASPTLGYWVSGALLPFAPGL